MGEDLLMLREQTREDFVIPEVESDMEVEDADDAKEEEDDNAEVEEEVENDDNEEDEIEREEEDDDAEMVDEEEEHNMEEGEDEDEEEEKEREEKNDAQGIKLNVLQIKISIKSLVFIKQRIFIFARLSGRFAPIYYFLCKQFFFKKNIVKQNNKTRI